MKPRIVLLTDYPIDFRTFAGGVETSVAGLLEGLKDYQEEFEFHVISAPRGLQHGQVIVHQGFHYHFLALAHPWLRPRFPFRVMRIMRELRQISPAVVHCQGSIDMALVSIWGRYPRLLTIHGVKREEARRRIGWERWAAVADALIEPFVFRRFKNFICISDYAAKIAGTGKKTYCIPNAVRQGFFNLDRKTEGHFPKLLYIGLLSPLKRPTDLIEAHKRMREKYPSLETVFCGEPESKPYWLELQSAASKGICFAGTLDKQAILKELRQATALVLPSSQENAPMVVAEAMASGVPVVATEVGGIPELLKHGKAGILYKAGDIDGLTNALQNLFANPELAIKLTKIAQDEARRLYLPTQVATQTVQAYRDILHC